MRAWEHQVYLDLLDIANTGDWEDGTWWERWAWDIWQDRDWFYDGTINDVSFIEFRAATRAAKLKVEAT